jgi:signal transduction histidine kinase
VEQWSDETANANARVIAQHLIAMQEEDRQRISRELHDQMAQYLSAMMLELESLKEEGDPRKRKCGVEHLQDLIQQIGQEVHRLTWDLRPAPIEEVGFRNALEGCVEDLSSHSSMHLYFYSNLAREERFPPYIETLCYRIVQEGLTNIARHAQAESASVVVTRAKSELQIILEDNGVGFAATDNADRPPDHDHLGLRGMQERIALIQGTLQIESNAGRGTSLFARIPLHGAGAA